jgi:hypothetical protein
VVFPVPAPGLEGDPQRLARAEQVLLPDDLVERARSHALGERSARALHLYRRCCVVRTGLG